MTNNDASNLLNGFIEYLKSLDNKYNVLYEYATSFMQAQGHTFTAGNTEGTVVTEENSLKDRSGEILQPYSLYISNNTILVYLRPLTNLPYFEDHVASNSACTGVDLTDPANWIDACAYVCNPSALCWNVLDQKHEIIYRPEQLTKLDGYNDGYIPFDHATGQLRAVLSLLKFAQDKLYGKAYFETQLKPVKEKIS